MTRTRIRVFGQYSRETRLVNFMKIISSICFVIIATLGLNMGVSADDELSMAAVREKLNRIRPDLPVKEVNLSDLPGFYEVTLTEGTMLFVKSDASYFIAGDLYRIEPTTFVNVSEEKRNQFRRDLLATLDESEMVVFSPPEGLKKTSITVFTDIDCGYCRKLHQEVPELNRLGIEVRYLAYPRAGLESRSYEKYVSAWCADNQQLALTRAKLGKEVQDRTCDNPVAAQYALGNQFGVSGTPAIIYEDGTLQPGYAPAAQLAIRLGIN